jgi:hypothetical protein
VFEGEDDERHLIERIVGPLGLRVDGSSPWVDARLPSGSRVHAIIPPLSLCGLAGSHDRTLEGVFDAHERAVFCSASSPPRHRCDARIWAEIEWHQAESVHETSLVDERVDGTRRAEVASRSGAAPCRVDGPALLAFARRNHGCSGHGRSGRRVRHPPTRSWEISP